MALDRCPRRWALPSLLTAGAIAVMVALALPRLQDGSSDVRHVVIAMQDEFTVLDGTWRMVARGNLNYGAGAGVYPGLYPYSVAVVKVLSGASASAQSVIERTRRFSLWTMVLAMLVPFILLARAAKNPWVGAIFTIPLAIHPETVLWASRVHPDAALVLFQHSSLALFALHVDTRARKYLFGATALAALSAATKMVGVFVLLCILAWLIWTERQDWKRLARALLVQLLLFALIFIAFNPRLVTEYQTTIGRWVAQHHRNRHGGAERLTWLSVFAGSRGLGLSGLATAVIGIVQTIRARRLDGVAMIAAFGLLYLLFLFATVRLALPRYGFPAMWPLFFVGLVALQPSHWKRPWLAWCLIGALLLTYVAVDSRAQRIELENDRTQYTRNFTPEKAEIARYITGIAPNGGGRVIASLFSYIPAELEWTAVWSMDEARVLTDDTFAIIVDEAIRSNRGEQYEKLVRGELGFAATSTIGEFVIYTRGVPRALGAH